jgi:signal transduction histidine kinase
MLSPPHLRNFALRIPLLLLTMVFFVESAIMAVFAVTDGESRSPWFRLVVDSSILTLAIAPLMYWLIVIPLKRLADQRSRLLEHMMDIQEEERGRVARDLHDEIGQSFTSLLVRLRLLQDAPDLQSAKEQAGEIRDLSASIYDQIRGLARTLHPTVLEDLGLVEAVRRMVEDFGDAHGITVALHVEGVSTPRIPKKIESATYRVIQESLTNCAKYACATRVDVSLTRDVNMLTAIVADNGRGFDAETTKRSTSGTTFGLVGMQERAVLLGGKLEVRSRAGQGTTVTWRVPLRD